MNEIEKFFQIIKVRLHSIYTQLLLTTFKQNLMEIMLVFHLNFFGPVPAVHFCVCFYIVDASNSKNMACEASPDLAINSLLSLESELQLRCCTAALLQA